MSDFNQVVMTGRLTKNPQLSYLPSQTPVCEISIATNHRWKDQQGQQKESVCFVDCRCIGKQAETINKYFKKGRPILVSGRLEFDQWQDKSGQNRSKHRVFIERFVFLDKTTAPDSPAQPEGATPELAPSGAPTNTPTDDIPF